MSETGNRIKERRQLLKMSMEELASAVGYSSATRKTIVYNVESGKNEAPLSKITEYAKALHTNTYYLLGISMVSELTDDDIIVWMSGVKNSEDDGNHG